MKKLISFLLAVTMLFALVSVAFAASDVTPVIVVSGMGTDQYKVAKDGTKTMVWPPQAPDIAMGVATVIPGIVMNMIDDIDIEFNTDSFLDGIKDLFEPISCNPDGTLKYNIEPDYYPLAISNYPGAFNSANNLAEKAICRSIGDKIGYDNSYFFNYTFSRNPMDLAEELDEYIDSVLSQTGAKKVSLIACSMGGTITMSYIYKFGTSKLKNVTFASTAFLGTEIVGQLFTKDIKISIYDALNYFSEFTGYDFVKSIVKLVQTIITTSEEGLFEEADAFFAEFVAKFKELAFSDVFLDTFVTMPGIWALIPGSYYKEAKAALVTDKSNYTFLENGENSIDNYINNVQSKAASLISKARANGVNVYVTATYMCPGIPVQADCSNYTDNLIDVKYAGGYATAAKYGEKLTGTLGTKCSKSSHNHLSPDSIIDASTCILPEQTWFIKNVGHMNYEYGTGTCGLLTILATSKDEVSINTYASYPQFTEFNNVTNTLNTSFKEDGSVSDIVSLCVDILKKVLAFIKDYFSLA